SDATVTLHGVHAINPAIRTVGDRLEIDVADESPAQAQTFNDATIKKVEVIGGAHAKIVVQIKHSTKTTEILGKAARVDEKGDELPIRVPPPSNPTPPPPPTPS